MKFFVRAVLIMFACTLAACSKPEVGVWGGKWNDELPVFLKVDPGKQSGTYTVFCKWLRKPADTAYFERSLPGLQVDSRIEARWLIFKVTGDTAMVYGGQRIPMMANLVRMKGKNIPEPDKAEVALLNAGWKPGAISPNEARAKLMSK